MATPRAAAALATGLLLLAGCSRGPGSRTSNDIPPGWPPIIAAAREGDIERVRAILGADPAAVRARQGVSFKREAANQGRTALHFAAERDDLSMTRLLLSRGANPDARDEFGYRPLHVACGAPVVRALLNAGADPSARTDNRQTPLHEARGAAIAVLLLDAGARVDARERFRQTALHEAADRGDAELVALLLDRGADARALDAFGRTPLHDAASTRPEVVRLLLARGSAADVDTPSDAGDRPLDEAVEWGRTEIVRLLVEHGADVRRADAGYTYLHAAALRGRAETAALLVDLGLDVDAGTSDGVTPLLLAADNGRIDCVRALLDRGADPRARAADGRTPLSVASTEPPYHEIQGTSEDTGRHREAWRAECEERKAVAALLRERGAAE